MFTVIRGGSEAVAVATTETEIKIEYGPDAINATIHLDFGEARELAETILADLKTAMGWSDDCQYCGDDIRCQHG